MESCAYKSLGILFKSLIANMAGFLLWLSITSIMIEVFKVALSAIAIILSKDMIYFTMKGIVPSCCRMTTRHLGATLFKLRSHQIFQVPCHCQHAPWHLGANAKSFFHHLIEDPTHHIVMSRPLGATNCSCQQFKVHKS